MHGRTSISRQTSAGQVQPKQNRRNSEWSSLEFPLFQNGWRRRANDPIKQALGDLCPHGDRQWEIIRQLVPLMPYHAPCQQFTPRHRRPCPSRDVGADGTRFYWVIQVFTSVLKWRAPRRGRGYERFDWLRPFPLITPLDLVVPDSRCHLSFIAASPYPSRHFRQWRPLRAYAKRGAAAVEQGARGNAWFDGSVSPVIRQKTVSVKTGHLSPVIWFNVIAIARKATMAPTTVLLCTRNVNFSNTSKTVCHDSVGLLLRVMWHKLKIGIYKGTQIQGGVIGNDSRMYTEICPLDVPFIREQYGIKNKSSCK